MTDQPGAAPGQAPAGYVGGDHIVAGDISFAQGVAIGRNAQALVNRIEQGDLIEHQEIININLDFGTYSPLAQEVLLEAIASHLGLKRGSLPEAVRQEAPPAARRQIRELVAAERAAAAEGVPTTPRAAYDLGMMAAYRRDYDEALGYFRKAATADPAFSEAFKAISWLQQSRAMRDIGRRDYPAALSKLAEAQQAAEAVSPPDARSLALQGYVAKSRAQIAEAQGDDRAQAGHLAAAEQFFGQVTSLAPDDAAAWCGLGNVAYARGQLEAAIDAYQQAITLAPNYTAAYNDLALAYEAMLAADEAHGAPWRDRAILAWEQARDLAARDPGFGPDYGQRVARRIRSLKLQSP